MCKRAVKQITIAGKIFTRYHLVSNPSTRLQMPSMCPRSCSCVQVCSRRQQEKCKSLTFLTFDFRPIVKRESSVV